MRADLDTCDPISLDLTIYVIGKVHLSIFPLPETRESFGCGSWVISSQLQDLDRVHYMCGFKSFRHLSLWIGLSRKLLLFWNARRIAWFWVQIPNVSTKFFFLYLKLHNFQILYILKYMNPSFSCDFFHLISFMWLAARVPVGTLGSNPRTVWVFARLGCCVHCSTSVSTYN